MAEEFKKKRDDKPNNRRERPVMMVLTKDLSK